MLSFGTFQPPLASAAYRRVALQELLALTARAVNWQAPAPVSSLFSIGSNIFVCVHSSCPCTGSSEHKIFSAGTISAISCKLLPIHCFCSPTHVLHDFLQALAQQHLGLPQLKGCQLSLLATALALAAHLAQARKAQQQPRPRATFPALMSMLSQRIPAQLPQLEPALVTLAQAQVQAQALAQAQKAQQQPRPRATSQAPMSTLLQRAPAQLALATLALAQLVLQALVSSAPATLVLMTLS